MKILLLKIFCIYIYIFMHISQLICLLVYLEFKCSLKRNKNQKMYLTFLETTTRKAVISIATKSQQNPEG